MKRPGHSRRGSPARTRGEAGVSIVELLVSLTLFSLIVGSLVTLIATGLSVARNNKDRSVAAHVASQTMDRLRQQDFGEIAIGQTNSSKTIGSVKYDVQTDTEWVANAATTNACDSASGSPRVLRATVTVTWPNMRGTQPVETSTEITPPVGSYDPLNGHIAVRIRDRDAGSLGGVPVRVVGPGVDRTQTSLDGSGCAFFGFLAPGNYGISLGTPGWVDRQSDATPSQRVGVTAETTTSVAFDYDNAATLQATLTGTGGGAPATGVPVTLANTAFLPSGTKTAPGVGTLRIIANLFPFSAGVQAWAGACADADPEGADAGGAAYWPGALRDPAISLTPGSTVAATVSMGTVDLDFGRVTPGAPANIVAIHDPDSGCPSGQTLSIAAFAGATGSQKVALPWGRWRIEASATLPRVDLGHGDGGPDSGVDRERSGEGPMMRRDESGQSSIIEITAVLLILGIVIGFLFSSIESADRAVNATRMRISNLDEARTLMAVLTKDLRTATRLQAGTAPFVAADKTDVTFYANLNNVTGGPRKIRIWVGSKSEISAAVWAPDAGSVAPNYTYSGSPKIRYVGRYLANPPSQPVFEYFDDAGTKLTTPVSAADRLAISSVRITLAVRADTNLPNGTVTLEDQVRLPNVDYQATADGS